MRTALPSRALCRMIVGHLHDLYAEPHLGEIRAALGQLTNLYGLPPPRLRWMRRSELRKRRGYYTLGMTYMDGVIALTHPMDWGRDEADWIITALHEAWHYIHTVGQEQKADKFAHAIMERAE